MFTISLFAKIYFVLGCISIAGGILNVGKTRTSTAKEVAYNFLFNVPLLLLLFVVGFR